MQRYLFFLYGVGSHLMFLGTFAYMAGFVGDFLVPKTIDTTVTGSLGAALAICAVVEPLASSTNVASAARICGAGR